MLTEVRLPEFSRTICEGTIVGCLVKIGDKIEKGDRIFEIEVDKTAASSSSISQENSSRTSPILNRQALYEIWGTKIMKKQGLIPGLTSVIVISIVIVSIVSFTIYNTRLIGPTIVLLGFIPWFPLKISGRTIKSCAADIVFGAIDTAILGIAALIGASFAGVLGAIVGGAVGDSITDGFAGLFEGRMAEYLRKHGIEETRTPLSSSMGKMSGCLIGVGIVLTIAWGLLEINFYPR